MSDLRRISKTLSYWLRHRPEAGGLMLDSAGWASVTDVIGALERAGMPGGVEALRHVVAESDKNRFELSPDGVRIRARQGHSIVVDLGWPQADPPQFLFHGTVAGFVPAILAEGLKPMKRHHVHLSPDVETARGVGARRGEPLILRIAAGRMAQGGHRFLLSGNGVWLAEHVPPEFIERVAVDEEGGA